MSWKSTLPTPPPKAPGWSTVLPVHRIITRPGWVGHQKVWRTANLSGEGGLTAEAHGRHQVESVSLSGTGNLSAAVMVRRFRDADLSGGGELEAAALGPVFRSVEFSSDGSFSAAALGPRFVEVNFAGNGELGWDDLRYPRFVDANFNGQGILGADAITDQPQPDGLSATVIQRYEALAAFAGSGELTIALSEIEHILGPGFTAAGELSAIIKQIQYVTADFSGGGSLQAIAGHLAALAGSGTLSASAFELLVALRDAALSGAGTVAATTGGERYRPNAAAGGSGSMTATAFARYLVDGNLSGDGGLSAGAVAQVAYNVGATSDYNSNAKTDSQSFTLNGVRADDYVLVFTSGDDDASPTMQLANANMTQLARLPFNNNSGQTELQCYGIKSATAGNKSIAWTGNSPGSVILGAVAYSNEVSVGDVATSFGTGGLAAQSASCGPGEVIVQAFGSNTASWTPDGGNVRVNTSDGGDVPLIVMDNVGAANFSATGTVGNWAGISVILRPT
jgi:hypothetical protein